MKKLILLSLLVLPAAAWAQSPDRELFAEAETRFRSQDYELALDRYSALISEYPLSQYVPDAEFRKAVALYRLKRYTESLQLFDRIETRYRSTRYLRYVPFWKGVVEYYVKNYSDSIADLDRYLSDTGGVPVAGETDLGGQALLYRALDQIAQGQTDRAIATLDKMVGDEKASAPNSYGLSLLMSLYHERSLDQRTITLFETLDPKSLDPAWRPRIELYAAEAYYDSGQSAKAEPLYTQLQDAEPAIATVAFQRLFQIQKAKGDAAAQDRVLRSAEVALAGRPDVLAQFWLTVGIESYQSGKNDLASLYFQRVWDLRKTQQIDGSDPLYLAELAVKQGNATQATSYLTEYLGLIPAWKTQGLNVSTYEDRILLELGGIYLGQENWSGAADDFRIMRQNFPESPLFSQASYQYAYALYRLADLGNALSVANDLFAQGRAGGYSSELLRLEANILQKQGQTASAIQSLKEYLVQRPNDVDARVDYAKLLFQNRQFSGAAAAASAVLDTMPKLQQANPSDYVQLKYILGVSYVSMKDYQNALAQLGEFKTVAAIPQTLRNAPGLSVLYPYELYYLGWAYYRTGKYSDAMTAYGELLREYPTSKLAPRSAYLAGWSAYSSADYAKAEAFLAKVSTSDGDPGLFVDANLLLGQSYVRDSKFQQALLVFKNIYVTYPDSTLADDARYEYAGALASLGNTDEAASAYDALYQQYPKSPLAEQGLYDRGDLLYQKGRFADAREAFFYYRTNFPDGRLVDAALYWGGMASLRLNEPSGALLLWERLIAQQPSSSYRSDAMYRAAQIYQQRGDYRSALNLYTEMIARYPDEAKAVDAQRKSDELVLLIGGLSEQEASLWVTINNSGKASTDKGRQAILELARLVSSQSGQTSINQSLVLPLLQDVAGQAKSDPASASQAKFLLGDFYARQPDYLKAAQTYLDAAVTNSADQDLAALSLYRAAEMYKLAGRSQQTSDLVARIQKDFPKSEWAAEAAKLLENS